MIWCERRGLRRSLTTAEIQGIFSASPIVEKKIMCLLSKKVTSDFFSKLKYIFFRLISLFHLYTFFLSFCEFKSRIYIHILKEDIFSIYKNKPLEGFKLFPIFLLAKSMPSIWFQFAKIFAVKLHFSVQVPLPGLPLQSASPALAALAWSVEGKSARAMQHWDVQLSGGVEQTSCPSSRTDRCSCTARILPSTQPKRFLGQFYVWS